MARPRPVDENDMDSFIEDDSAGVNTQSSWAPQQSSPSTRPPPSAQQPRRSLLNPHHDRRRAGRPICYSSSIDINAAGENVEDVLSPAKVRNSVPLRDAAANAYSPIRKHARIDLGYASDVAEADDSDDSDKLDAESQDYAPFETQVESELENEEWSDIPDCEDVGSLTGNVTTTSDRLVELVSAIDTDGYLPLIDAMMTAEHESGSKFGTYLFEEEKAYWEAMSLSTLCSMPEQVVKELICGNLKQAYDSDQDLREKLDEFRERGKQHPCIYARTLTTADGKLMTTAEARRLVKWLHFYVSVSPRITEDLSCTDAFKKIDHQFGAQWKRINPAADRVYLASKKQTRLPTRVDNVLLFCRELLARCETSESKGTPLKPLTYIGYAARADRRRRQHEACGKSSNWLATLVQAVCNVLWGQGRYQMHFMVICMLSFEAQGMVAEMLLTRIAGAYYNTGGGFCIDVAGKSMESLYFKSLTHHQNVDKWNELSEWVSANTNVEANKAECIRKMRDKQEQLITARITQTQVLKDEMLPAVLRHFVRNSLWSSTMMKHGDNPVLQDDAEVAKGVAESSLFFEDLTRLLKDKGSP